MPQTDQTPALLPNYDGTYNSYYPDGDKPEELIVITGAGFGAGPNVVLFKDYASRDVGGTAELSDGTGVGDFDFAHYATSLLPTYQSIGGKTGITMREGGTDPNVDNRLTGFVKILDPFTDYLIAFDMGVPPGRNFSGASEPETMPSVSALKTAWLSDGALDHVEKADICTPSWTSASFALGGNNSSAHLSMGSAFDFNAWNGFLCCQIAGADPFIDNGYSETLLTTSAGTTVKTRTNMPTFPLGNAQAAQYTHLSWPAWSGNGSQTLTQHLYSYIYFAVGPNARARVELLNDADYASATKRVALPPYSWTDTKITVVPPASLKSDMTHYCVTTAAGDRTMGELA